MGSSCVTAAFLLSGVCLSNCHVDNLLEAANNLVYSKNDLQSKVNAELQKRSSLIEVSNLRDFFSALGNTKGQSDITVAYAYSDTCPYSQKFDAILSDYLAKPPGSDSGDQSNQSLPMFIKINVRTVKELRPMVRSYGSKGTPSLIGFRSGQFIKEQTGVSSIADVNEFIDSLRN